MRRRALWLGWWPSKVMLCGVEGEDVGTGPTLCPACAQVASTLNFCGLGPESLRQFFSVLRATDPSALKAQIEALRGPGVQRDMQARAHLN